MNTPGTFQIHATDGAARTGVLQTAHGPVNTPIFMPVGTVGSVKAIAPDDLNAIGAEIILGNTYHLYLRPGDELVARRGGLHGFNAWDKPILTDSGGFQVFSLSTLRTIKEEGVTFRSHLDGSKHLFTPEKVVSIQRNLNSDIMMVLDECVPAGADHTYTARSLTMTTRWAKRCRDAYPKGTAGNLLFGIVQGGIASDVPVLLCADDLAPSETIQLDKSKVLGFITAGGSGSSHTAILARTLGIPAIVGMGDALKPELEGRAAIADGSTGALVIDPDDDTRDRLLKKRDEQLRLQRLLETLKGQANVTKDGKTIRIYCNIGSPEDVHAVQVNDGGGIGLFRSEFLYLNTTDYPTEDQQFEAYKQVLSDMDGKEVIIRTLDIGADKQIGYFDLPKEDNPAMGMRALRICLTRPEIFKTQLRALFRASAFGKLGIMFPMVTSVWEVREAKRMCEEVRRELKNEGIPYSEDVQIGIMIETPAAAINSDRLAKEVDFFSIGTNDLTQYTLACDRQNNDLGRFYDPHHPAVLRLIRLVTENAHKNGIWVGICGELGADLTLTETFLAFGVDELSVTPRSVLPLRNAVRMTDTRESSERILSDLDSDYTAR